MKYIVTSYSPFIGQLHVRVVESDSTQNAAVQVAIDDGWENITHQNLIDGSIEDKYFAVPMNAIEAGHTFFRSD